MDETISTGKHAPVFESMAERHRIPVTEVIDRILRHGIENEYEIFDWSPAPLREPEPVEAVVPGVRDEEIGERQSA